MPIQRITPHYPQFERPNQHPDVAHLAYAVEAMQTELVGKINELIAANDALIARIDTLESAGNS